MFSSPLKRKHTWLEVIPPVSVLFVCVCFGNEFSGLGWATGKGRWSAGNWSQQTPRRQICTPPLSPLPSSHLSPFLSPLPFFPLLYPFPSSLGELRVLSVLASPSRLPFSIHEEVDIRELSADLSAGHSLFLPSLSILFIFHDHELIWVCWPPRVC